MWLFPVYSNSFFYLNFACGNLFEQKLCRSKLIEAYFNKIELMTHFNFKKLFKLIIKSILFYKTKLYFNLNCICSHSIIHIFCFLAISFSVF
jgi:hypothetical protein